MLLTLALVPRAGDSRIWVWLAVLGRVPRGGGGGLARVGVEAAGIGLATSPWLAEARGPWPLTRGPGCWEQEAGGCVVTEAGDSEPRARPTHRLDRGLLESGMLPPASSQTRSFASE